ncbi:MAG TPA: hypothetical protein VN108_06610, partial [Marmoricola sp.]|nr:hypothetical protein [Marmoricola sp.]
PSLEKGQSEQDRGEFGAFALYLVLAERIPTTQALAAADSWGGDQYASYTENNRTCVQDAFTGQTTQGTQRITMALGLWAKGSGGAASVSRHMTTVTLNACDPGPNYRVPADRSMHALELLAMRNGIESSVEKDGPSLQFAVCYASTLVQQFSIAVLSSDKASRAAENQFRRIATNCYANP